MRRCVAFEVVVSEQASDSEKFAAREFVRCWRLTAGCDIPMLQRRNQGVVVLIGHNDVPGDLLATSISMAWAQTGCVSKTYMPGFC